MNLEISPKLLAYLRSWHGTATTRKRQAGNTVDLSFQAFLLLFSSRQLASLQRAIDNNRIRYLQSDQNGMAYVLTWRSYAACSTGSFNSDTACVCSRWKSAQLNLPQPGDKLRPGHKAKISAALAGKPKSEEHAASISEALTGRTLGDEHKANLRHPKRPWTEERKRAASERASAREAAKRETSNGR